VQIELHRDTPLGPRAVELAATPGSVDHRMVDHRLGESCFDGEPDEAALVARSASRDHTQRGAKEPTRGRAAAGVPEPTVKVHDGVAGHEPLRQSTAGDAFHGVAFCDLDEVDQRPCRTRAVEAADVDDILGQEPGRTAGPRMGRAQVA
jgi:hypothetical protein